MNSVQLQADGIERGYDVKGEQGVEGQPGLYQQRVLPEHTVAQVEGQLRAREVQPSQVQVQDLTTSHPE